MKRERDERLSPPALGGTALLVIFAVLCLAVFALLSLSTVRAEKRLSDDARDAVTAYYAIDMQAQEIFARLRAGEDVPGVREQEGMYAFECADPDGGKLVAEIEKTDTGWRVLRWQIAAQQVKIDESLPVWTGR